MQAHVIGIEVYINLKLDCNHWALCTEVGARTLA